MATKTAQLYSQTHYLADGSTTLWDFYFDGGYLDKDHVKAYKRSAAGVRTELSVTLTSFVTDFRIRIKPAVASGDTLVIFRDTPNGIPLVDWKSKAVITREDLAISAAQALFVAAETADYLGVADDGDIYALALAAALAVSQSSASAAAADASAVASEASAVAALAAANSIPAFPLDASQVEVHGNDITPILDSVSALPTKAPQDYGVVGDGITDDTANLRLWAAYAGPRQAGVMNCKVTGTITVAPGVVNWDGVNILPAAGTYTGGVVVSQGSLTALPAPSGALSEGAVLIPFSATHNLSPGDVVVLYHTDTGSWASTRPEYRAGEFVTVRSVPSGSSITITRPLYDSYGSGKLTAHKLAPHPVHWRGLTVRGVAGTALAATKISLATSGSLDIDVPFSNYMGVQLDRCYAVKVVGGAISVPETALANCYGLFVGNSQHIRVRNTQLFALQGAFDIGGDSLTGCVSSRDVLVESSSIANDAASGFPAVDLHGNLQDFVCRGCTISGGVSWAGVNVSYLDNIYNGVGVVTGALAVGGSEWYGGLALMRGGSISMSNGTSLGAVVRLVQNLVYRKDTVLRVEKMLVNNMSTCTLFALTEMATGTSGFISTHISDVEFVSAPALTQVLRCQGTGAGGNGKYVKVDNISGGNAGVFLYITANGFGAATPARLMRQTARGSVALNTAQPVSSINPLTWRYNYGSKIPVPTGQGIDTRIVGTAPLGNSYRAITAATGVLDIFTTNNTNPVSALTVAGYLSVGVNEL